MACKERVVIFSAVWATKEEIDDVVSVFKQMNLQGKVVFFVSKNCDFFIEIVDEFFSVELVGDVASFATSLKGYSADVIVFASHSDLINGVNCFNFFERRPFYIALHGSKCIQKNRNNANVYNRKVDVNAIISVALREEMMAGDFLRLQNVMLLERESDGLSRGEVLCYAIDCLFGRESRVGFDKLYKDYSSIRLSYITHFYCNQNDISSVIDLLRRYENYPDDVKSKVQFVIVDDGSPVDYSIPDFSLNLTWIKIDQDIKWNQAGARNLGAVYAKSDTIMLTDLDHELPLESMRRIISMRSCGKRFYKMYRKDPSQKKNGGRLYKGHSNLFVMSRGRFMECFGYDEEFAGAYGAEDIRFAKYQKISGSLQSYLPKSITCFERLDINRNKSYHSLSRDLTFNTPVDSRKRYEFSEFGNGFGHSRQFLNFTWHVKKQFQFLNEGERQRNRLWKVFSIFRQILPRF